MTDDPIFTRRRFLHRLGGGLAVASFGTLPLAYPEGSVAAARAAGPRRKLGWAIVGLGSYATRQILPRMHECEYSQPVALVSGSPEKARTIADEYGVAHRNIYTYQNYDSIADNPEAQLVAITAPSAASREAAAKAYPQAKVYGDHRQMLAETKMGETWTKAIEGVYVQKR